MTDIVSRAKRSEMMAGIRGKDTKPERIVRSLIHQMGFRFRLHARDLVGRPDVVIRKYRKVVFVHGCFWHRHARCKYAYEPKTRRRFWQEKFQRNVERDREIARSLRKAGWTVLVIWECQTRDVERLSRRLNRLLNQ